MSEAKKRVHLSEVEFIKACNAATNVAEVEKATGMSAGSIRQRRTQINNKFGAMGLDSPLTEYRRGGGGGGVGSRQVNSTAKTMRELGYTEEQIQEATAKLRAKLESESAAENQEQEAASPSQEG